MELRNDEDTSALKAAELKGLSKQKQTGYLHSPNLLAIFIKFQNESQCQSPVMLPLKVFDCSGENIPFLRELPSSVH